MEKWMDDHSAEEQAFMHLLLLLILKVCFVV